MHADPHTELVLAWPVEVFARHQLLQFDHGPDRGHGGGEADEGTISGRVHDTASAVDGFLQQIEVQLLQAPPGLVAELREITGGIDDIGKCQRGLALEAPGQLLRQHGLESDDLGHRQAGRIKRGCHRKIEKKRE